MPDTRRIAFYLFDGFETLDVAGPASVFTAANVVSGCDLYDMVYVSAAGGQVMANSHMPVATDTIDSAAAAAAAGLDMAFFPGADAPALKAALCDDAVIAGGRQLAAAAARTCSVCTGAFLLAATGYLDGRRATTHWAARKDLARAHAGLNVADDSLYVVDGPCWTSAGASAGIDMTLALLKADHGNGLMRKVAQWLVVYTHRPGRQSQFSSLLAAQTSDGGFSDLIAWMHHAMPEQLTVADLANRVGMSERTFYRRFTGTFGETPARFLDKIRLERAKAMLEDGAQVKRAAHSAGYRTESGFRAAFEAAYGIAPSLHRALHSDDATD